ncbi:MAG: rhomboid family intramembrane serine protease [Bacteroidales bacterium]|nr:rhomboid family intramembrane serine protease [Bacteroidales bacterium]
MNEKTDSKTELKKMLLATVIPASFIFIFWMIYLLEISLNISLSEYGLRPREISQWFGILTMPFLHGGFEHIIANTTSFLVLGSLLFYFYNDNAIQIFVWSYVLSGLFTWIIGRNNIHIGASAMIYAFAGYLFTAGVLSKNIRHMAIALIVVFLYGSMIWGIFPMNNNVSWEGHLAGAAVGIALSFMYRPPKYIDEYAAYSEFDDDCDCTENDDIEIKYSFKDESNKQE